MKEMKDKTKHIESDVKVKLQFRSSVVVKNEVWSVTFKYELNDEMTWAEVMVTEIILFILIHTFMCGLMYGCLVDLTRFLASFRPFIIDVVSFILLLILFRSHLTKYDKWLVS